MQLILQTFQLNCFTSNTTVILSKQTKQATFTAQPLTDGSKDNLVCNQLAGSLYTAKIYFGANTYVLPTQLTLTMTAALTIVFPCADGSCTTAFSATSASFEFFFSDTNEYVQDAISVFTIDSYNRLSCLKNQLISYDIDAKVILIQGSPQQCSVPLDQTQDLILNIVAYPDFSFTKIISLSGVTSLSNMFTSNKLFIDCDADYTETMLRSCQRMIQYFQDHVSNYAEITISFPGDIPDNTSLTYSRETMYSIYFEINTVSASFVQHFDCYNSQEVIFFSDIFRMTFPINTSKVHCAAPMKDFLGDFDHSVLVIQVQSNVDFRIGTVYTFTFKDQIFDLYSDKPWYPCDSEEGGHDNCVEKLATIWSMPSRTTFISRSFYKNGVLLEGFSMSSTNRNARAVSARMNVSKTELCLFTTEWITVKQTLQVRIQLVSGHPRFSITGHDVAKQFDIRGQFQYPTPERQYCFKYTLNESQTIAYDYLRTAPDITGFFSWLGTQVAIVEVNFAAEGTTTDYLIISTILAVIVAGVWFVITLIVELRRKVVIFS
ncbi:Conserved_hypothetical protein [Hexamita inflata]|uniref:Uncharacterized protein n=1 Tax=Hexamita inflata TaxID=28002 RepID=A0AA86NXV2_9EUKA|nr:Conserved hypothetical protein [Hexamita inflata]